MFFIGFGEEQICIIILMGLLWISICLRSTWHCQWGWNTQERKDLIRDIATLFFTRFTPSSKYWCSFAPFPKCWCNFAPTSKYWCSFAPTPKCCAFLLLLQNVGQLCSSKILVQLRSSSKMLVQLKSHTFLLFLYLQVWWLCCCFSIPKFDGCTESPEK